MKPTLQMRLPICSRVWNRHPVFNIDKYHKFVYFHHVDIQTTQDTGTDQVNSFLMWTDQSLWTCTCFGLLRKKNASVSVPHTVCRSYSPQQERRVALVSSQKDSRWRNKEDNRRSERFYWVVLSFAFTQRLAAGASIQDKWFRLEMSNSRTKNSDATNPQP